MRRRVRAREKSFVAGGDCHTVPPENEPKSVAQKVPKGDFEVTKSGQNMTRARTRTNELEAVLSKRRAQMSKTLANDSRKTHTEKRGR